jgi:LysM repeat protein
MNILSFRWLFPSAAALVIASCANKDEFASNDLYGTGPFDSQGNYREDWADDPTKWRRPGSRQKARQEAPFYASNDRPPANVSPLPPARPSQPASTSRPAASTSKPAQSTQAARPTQPARPTATAAAAKPKPKPKPKPAPQPTRYTVKKGDSLYVIAKRHNTTVAALQRANGISGSLIQPGQRLVIPR